MKSQENERTFNQELWGVNKSGSKLRIKLSEKLHMRYCVVPEGFSVQEVNSLPD